MTEFPPDVDEAVQALKAAFGTAYVQHTGGGCHSIWVPIEGRGGFHVGDIDGPLGESNSGWGVEMIGSDGDYEGPVANIESRSIPDLIEALRLFLRRGERTGMRPIDQWQMDRDAHSNGWRHFVAPTGNDRMNTGKPGCPTCQELVERYLAIRPEDRI
ncbi:hypothetical protein [Actinomadura kijaniata]|uniref:hypothetical protein n=1 Tax=Actinomadura kijaniata TaxID=46161 RepID=UPI00082D52EF|nr:hypothetical protein [Actinomadura kijaniata]